LPKKNEKEFLKKRAGLS